MATTHTQLPLEEVVNRGKRIYNSQIKDLVEPDNVGKYLSINVETGEWEMGDDHSDTVLRAFRRFGHPNVFGMRIGYTASASFGGALRPLNSADDALSPRSRADD